MSEPQPQPHLELALRHTIGPLALALELRLDRPWTVLFGPSGSGKTTVLRAIAGLIRPHEGRIVLRPQAFHAPGRPEEQLATDSRTGVFIPPHRRWVRWSSQNPALFPHLTVRENLRAALAATPAPAAARESAALTHFHLTGLAEKKPASLSGGERQLVAVARAAIAAPGRLLMLDEPFGGLDAHLRNRLLDDLRAWLGPTHTAVLSVTHDIGEAFQLADEVVKIACGRIAAQGPASTVLAAERASLIAQLDQGKSDPRKRSPRLT